MPRASAADRADHQGALGGDVHDIGPFGAPGAEQAAAGGQAGAEQRVARDGHAGVENLGEGSRAGGVGGVFGLALAGAVHGDGEAPLRQAGGEMAEGHGDAIDLGWEGFCD